MHSAAQSRNDEQNPCGPVGISNFRSKSLRSRSDRSQPAGNANSRSEDPSIPLAARGKSPGNNARPPT